MSHDAKPKKWLDAREPSEAETTLVRDAIRAAGFKNLREFLLQHTGEGLTEQAQALNVSPAAYVAVHNAWVAEHAPPPF